MDSIAGISYSIRVTQLPFRSMAVVGLEIYLININICWIHFILKFLCLQRFLFFRFSNSHSTLALFTQLLSWMSSYHRLFFYSVDKSNVGNSCCPAISQAFSSNDCCHSKQIAENWYDIVYWNLSVYLRHIERSP